MNRKLAFVFPGQGSQCVGMGVKLASRFEDFAKIYESFLDRADEILSFQLSKIMKEGPADRLKDTQLTQPALLTLSSAMSHWLQENDIHCQLALGHSLGEYSALVQAKTLEFENAIELVHTRGKLMTEAVPHGEGGMAALMGASQGEAQQLCNAVSKNGLILEVSVINSAGQIVVSGHRQAIADAGQQADAYGIRKLIPLEVSGPFHCSLLRGAGEKFRTYLENSKINRPSFPVIFNSTAQMESEPSKIIDNLVNQLSQPVLWSDSVHQACEEGFEEFVEVGSGKVLTGLIKKILPDAHCTPLEEIERIDLLAA